MLKRYPNLLSPLRIGNTVFRNRLFSAPMGLHAMQGGEPYPTQDIIETFSAKARGGAAMVTLSGIGAYPVVSDGEHILYDIYTAHSRHYLAQLADAVHFYGAKASMEIVGSSQHPDYRFRAGRSARNDEEIINRMPEEIMEEIAENYAFQAHTVQDLGYDMVLVHMAYCANGGGMFLSPAFNKRTDQYGGSVENRARFPILIFDRIKERCGKDFLIELRMSGVEPIPNGITIEDSIELAGILEGHIDLLQVHAGTMAHGHPMGLHGPTPNLGYAEAIKRSGTSLSIVTIGGNQDLDESEDIIASGKADVVSMARGWIADPELGLKAYEGRGEDVVPCIKCMRCHDSACLENRTFVCSVNPVAGLGNRMANIVRPPRKARKIAIVGGGPAGLEAALVASGRGHDVTLYERSAALGGQLKFADHISFKSSLAKFKNYLVGQIERSNTRILCNTEVTPEILDKAGYEVIIGALGATPITPLLPGIEQKHVFQVMSIFGNEKKLGAKVAVIGGGQAGCEAGLHLASLGLDVNVVEMQDTIAPDGSFSYRATLINYMDENENLRYVTNACCTSIQEDAVVIANKSGKESMIAADSVVIAAGMRAATNEAMELQGTGNWFVMIGDCNLIGNVSHAIRTGYAAAIQL